MIPIWSFSETACVGDDSDLVLLHELAGGEYHECVEELVEVERPVDVELLEDDVVHSIGTGDGTGVGGCGLGTGCGLSRLEHDDGLLDGHALDGFDELLTVSDTLGVDSDDLGVGVLGVVVQDLRLVDIALVTEGHEVGESESCGAGPVEDGGSYGSGLGEDGDVTLCGDQVGEGVVDSVPDVHVTEAVGSGDADSCLFSGLLEFLLHLGSLRTVLLETCGEDGHAFDAFLDTVLDGLEYEDVLDCDDCEFDGALDLVDVGVGLVAHDLPALGVDGVEFAFVAYVDHVLEQHASEFGLICGCTDDGHGTWIEVFLHEAWYYLPYYKANLYIVKFVIFIAIFLRIS